MKRHIAMIALAWVLVPSGMMAQDRAGEMVDDAGRLFRYACECGCHLHPVNDYSGINSLRARLAADGMYGAAGLTAGHHQHAGGHDSSAPDCDMTCYPWHMDYDEEYGYYSLYMGDTAGFMAGHAGNVFDGDPGMRDGMTAGDCTASCLSVPVYVFFRIGTAELTDSMQLVNIDAIAEAAVRWQLKVTVTGAGDAATGSADDNRRVSEARAERVAGMLVQRGVDPGQVEVSSLGGVEDFTPVESNRYCRIELR